MLSSTLNTGGKEPLNTAFPSYLPQGFPQDLWQGLANTQDYFPSVGPSALIDGGPKKQQVSLLALAGRPLPRTVSIWVPNCQSVVSDCLPTSY